MPGSAVHSHAGWTDRTGGTGAAIAVADIILSNFILSNLILSNYDAVVAEHFDFFAGGPEARGRALACAGVAYEEIAHAIGPDDSGAMQLNGTLLGEAVHDEEFVEGIRKWRLQINSTGKALLVHFDRCPVKLSVDEHSLISLLPQNRGAEVELEPGRSVLVQPPSRSRIKKSPSGHLCELSYPLDSNANISGPRLPPKQS